MAQEPINNPREELKQKRRLAFFTLVDLLKRINISNIYVPSSDFDKMLDDFFESGIELREREKHLGK